MNIQEALKSYYGYNNFRPMQEDIICHILGGNDCLVLMPTGGGKSICYQIPALIMEGTTIVVSPLISLMKDQVEALQANGIKAATLNSNATEQENRLISEKAIKGEYKLLYVSPERLLTELEYGIFQHTTANDPGNTLKINLFAIDEAHCISQWGHDFRPEYTQLGVLHDIFPNTPIAAFTATADKLTQEDIVQQLHLKEDITGKAKVFVSSFDRPNLSLDVRRGYSAKDKLRCLLQTIAKHKGESGIVYCMSRKTSESVAEKLREKGIKARAYHAGLPASERDAVQEAFINDEIEIVCATIAFGMGIDKSNVRFIVHYNLPKSIENYYQEIGRGGRDGLACETILFYQVGDIIMLKKFAEESEQKDINNEKLERMRDYAESQVCRRRILLNYFGEFMDHDCGNCDVCKNPPQRFDGTILVQKALSAIMRTKQQVGFTLLTDILRGTANQEVLRRGFQQLKTYGCGRDISFKDWQDYLLQMLHLGYIEINYLDNSHIHVTPQGENILYGRKQAQLAVISHEDFTVKGRKQKNQEEAQSILALDERNEDMELFEKLRQLRSKIAAEKHVPPYIIFGDKTLHYLASIQPEDITSFGSVSGIGKHKQESLGTTFLQAIRAHKGLSTDEGEAWNILDKQEDKPDKQTSTPTKKTRDFITLKGIAYHIDAPLLSSFKWRTAFDQISKDCYYNLWKVSRYPISKYVPEDTPDHDIVAKRFAEIATSAYGVTITPDMQWIEIPLHSEYDKNGMPVKSLSCKSFEEGLLMLAQFVEQNKHFPFANSDSFECSLRRWMQEISQNIIKLSPCQQQAYENFQREHADLPKNRLQWEKQETQ